MGVYQLETVLKMWEQGKLTTEQTVGQLLLHLQMLSERVGKLEKRDLKGRQSGKGA